MLKEPSLKNKYTIAYLMHGAKNVGGGEYSIYLLIKNLNREIFRPIVFYAFENEIIKKLKNDGIELIQIPLSKKISFLYRDCVRVNPFSLFFYAWRVMAEAMAFVGYLKKYKVNILHPHDNLSKIIGVISAKIAGVKIIAHCRDLLNNSLIERFLLFYQLLFMDKIIAVSENNRKLFKMGGKISPKVVVIHNGIDIKDIDSVKSKVSREGLNISVDKFVLGIIGVFDQCKGHIYLFQAIQKLISGQKDNVLCLVVGDGRLKSQLEGYVESNKLQKYIKFLGHRPDVPELLKIMDIVVIPSIQESFPRACLEAMALKVPVIASRIGGLPEMIEDGKTGILTSAGDADSICRAISYVMENRQIGRQMGEAARKKVEKEFSIEKNIRKTEEVYSDVLR